MVTDGASGGCVRDAVTGRVRVGLMRAGANGPIRATDITWPRFTADGRHVIVQLGGPRFGPERTVTLAVFAVATGRECASFARVGSGIWWGSALASAEYALSADGSTLAFSRATGHRTGQVTVWDIAAEKVVAEFPGLPPLALTPDGTALAYADTRSEVSFPVIRSLKSERPATTRVRGFGGFTSQGAGPVAFSPDGKLLAAKVSGQSEVVELRDVSSGQVRAVLDPNLSLHNDWFGPRNVWFSPDARILLLEDLGGNPPHQRVQGWDLSGASPRLGLQGPSESFTPDGSRAAIAKWDVTSRWDPVSRDNSVVRVFDLDAPQARIRLVETGVQKATIAPSGRILALPSTRSERDESHRDRSFVSLIRRAFGGNQLELEALSLPIIHFYEIKLRDASTGRLVSTSDCSARGHPPESMTFSPDSKTLVVKYLRADFKGWDSRNPMIDWSVELWDVPAGWPSGGFDSLVYALTAASLVLAGAWLDRRRALRRQ